MIEEFRQVTSYRGFALRYKSCSGATRSAILAPAALLQCCSGTGKRLEFPLEGCSWYDRGNHEVTSYIVSSILMSESPLRSCSWYDRGIPQGDELQSFVPHYEFSLSCGGRAAGTIENCHKETGYQPTLCCGGPAGTIEDYHKVTSYRVVSDVTKRVSAAQVQLVRSRKPEGDELHSCVHCY